MRNAPFYDSFTIDSCDLSTDLIFFVNAKQPFGAESFPKKLIVGSRFLTLANHIAASCFQKRVLSFYDN